VDQRNSRRQIAEQTLKELKQGYYVNFERQNISINDDVQHSIDGSRLYVKAELDLLLSRRRPRSSPYVVLVTRQSTLQCLISTYSEQQKTALLNFASAKNPGGGFLGGSQAQEESLARSSSLYPTLLQHQTYYESNKRAAHTFYIDNLIYSPQVVFFKNDEGNYLERHINADVITMPAVNKGALKFVDDQIQKQIDDVMKQRMRYVLAVSENNNVDTLILGAWGCGVFGNNPQNIADNFRHVLTENPRFDVPRIIFAIFDRGGETYHAFEPLSSV
jgi:uncharacterized protein (TIGR02452 family)